MSKTNFGLSPLRKCQLYQAAADFFFLQNRQYPRRSSLDWVGNRHQLNQTERELLHRGVFGQSLVLARRAKRCLGSQWQEGSLVVDGHNVLITVESAILGRLMVLANDGVLRDLAGQSARFRFSEASRLATQAILRFLSEFRPPGVLFLFDAPMNHSGSLAEHYRQELKAMGLEGDARTVPVPEREFPYAECTVASSDQAVLDASVRWLDLAHWVIVAAGLNKTAVDFSHLVPSDRVARNTFPGLF
jgi:hypothetical protein